MNQPAITTGTKHCMTPAVASGISWCVADVLEHLEEAVIVVDLVAAEILFSNQAASTLLASLQIDNNYQALNVFLLSRGIQLAADTNSRCVYSIIHNSRIIEFVCHSHPGQLASLLIRDMTEKKRLESIAQSINTMDNLGFIFSGIRHEIGNPLNSIKMTNSVLQKNLERFSLDDISRYIDRTAFEISRMEYLLQSLKNFSLYEKADCQPHDLQEFLSTLLGLIVPDLERRSICTRSELPADHVAVDIDPRGLHQAILNIITNAADAMTVRDDAMISITTRVNGRRAWIIIEDNGCGMTEEQLNMLFQPFHTSKTHGNGLGLVITQKLLTMMQATLEISSTPGRGTIASIGLPLARPKGNDEQP